ncbi:hypothetical protein Tco_1471580 [Tanacetum coccineum]
MSRVPQSKDLTWEGFDRRLFCQHEVWLFANARFYEQSASIGGPHLGRFLSEWQQKVSIRVVTQGFDLEGFQLAFKGFDRRCEFLIRGVSIGVSRGVSLSEVHKECLHRRPLIRELGETRMHFLLSLLSRHLLVVFMLKPSRTQDTSIEYVPFDRGGKQGSKGVSKGKDAATNKLNG